MSESDKGKNDDTYNPFIIGSNCHFDVCCSGWSAKQGGRDDGDSI